MGLIKKINTAIILGVMIMMSSFAFSAPSYQTAIPPSATLKYKVIATYNGMHLSGNSTMQWKTDLKTYSLINRCSVSFFGNVLNSASSGQVDENGLAPSSYSEKKLHKAFSATIYQSKGFFSPSDSKEPVSFSGRVQDHSSVIWQLSSIANAHKKSFAVGHTYTLPVIGHQKTKNWTFQIIRSEPISTPAGIFQTLVVSGHNGKNQTMTIWYAKDRYFYPVQLYFNDKGTFETQQTLSRIQ